MSNDQQPHQAQPMASPQDDALKTQGDTEAMTDILKEVMDEYRIPPALN